MVMSNDHRIINISYRSRVLLSGFVICVVTIIFATIVFNQSIVDTYSRSIKTTSLTWPKQWVPIGHSAKQSNKPTIKHSSPTFDQLKQCYQSFRQSINQPIDQPVQYHTLAARPFVDLINSSSSSCNRLINLLPHELAVAEYALLVDRMNASDDELLYFDLLGTYRVQSFDQSIDQSIDRIIDPYDEAFSVPFEIRPSLMLEFDQSIKSLDQPSCDHLHLGVEYRESDQSPSDRVTSKPTRASPKPPLASTPKLPTGMFTVHNTQYFVGNPANQLRLRSAANRSVTYDPTTCSPTASQPRQEQSLISITVNDPVARVQCGSVNQASRRASTQPIDQSNQSIKPPVTYLISRHNSNNAWHSLIEHIYPQYAQMFLRGAFPLQYQSIKDMYHHELKKQSNEQSNEQPNKQSNNHFELVVFHETGRPVGPSFDHWWSIMLGAPLITRPTDHASNQATSMTFTSDLNGCCATCHLGPPKLATIYNFWEGSKFVYDPSSLPMIRLFRRHVFARVGLDVPNPNNLQLYSFQSIDQCDNRICRLDAVDKLPMDQSVKQSNNQVIKSLPYIVPNFQSLLKAPPIDQSIDSPNYSWTRLADPNRNIFISPTLQSINQSIEHVYWSDLPLVIILRRDTGTDREMKPFNELVSFYHSIRSNLDYNVLFLFAEDFVLIDTITLFSRASMLISVEGAGLINALYLPLNSIVMEIECSYRMYDGGRPRPWHHSLSQYLGHLHLQWPIADCLFDRTIMTRMHNTIITSLHSKQRNKYLYLSI